MVDKKLNCSQNRISVYAEGIHVYACRKLVFTIVLQRTLGHFTVVCSVPWPLNRSEADGEHFWLQTFLLFMCKLWYSRADKSVNMIIYIRKTRRIVTKQGHRQPRFYSKAGALSAQLLNGLFTLNKLFVVFILYITTNYKCNVYNKDVLLCTNKCVNSQ